MIRLFLVILSSLLLGCIWDASFLIKKGDSWAEKQNYDKAAAYWERALHDPWLSRDETLNLLDRLIRAHKFLKNNEKLLELLYIKRNFLHDNQFVENQISILEILSEIPRWSSWLEVEAYRTLTLPLDWNQKCTILQILAQSLMQKRQYEEAYQEIEACLGNIPIDRKLAFSLGRIEVDLLVQKKEWLKAADRLQVIIQEFPEFNQDNELEFSLAQLFESIFEYDRALQVLDSLKVSDVSQAYLNFRKSRILFKKKQKAGAKLRVPIKK